MLTQEQLDHLLRTIDWQKVMEMPDADRIEEGKERLMAKVQKLQVHWRHVRIWRRACCSAFAALVVAGWIIGPLPLGIAIHATAQLPVSVRLLQETQGESEVDRSWLRKAWDHAVAFVTPASRSAAVTEARWDRSTGLIRATVRGTDGYVLVDPHVKTLVGVVGTRIPSGSQKEQPSLPLFARLELAREIASVDAAVRQTHSQTVAVAPLTAYRLSSSDRALSSAAMRLHGEYLQAGTFVAVQLQRSSGNGPELTAIVNTVERRVVQIVNTDQVRGMVVGEAAGSYAIVEPEAH